MAAKAPFLSHPKQSHRSRDPQPQSLTRRHLAEAGWLATLRNKNT